MNKMFKKNLLLFLATVLLAPAFQSCERDSDMMSSDLQLSRAPYNEWRLDGFAYRSNEATYSNSKQSYSVEKLDMVSPVLLTLQKEGVFSGNTPANTITGNFVFDSSRGTFSFLTIESTGYNEQPDGVRYLACLKSVASYAIFEKKLHLYYKDKTHFLLFSAVE